MDKRSILGFLLIMSVVFYWQFTRESAKLTERQAIAAADSLKQVEAKVDIPVVEDPTQSTNSSNSSTYTSSKNDLVEQTPDSLKSIEAQRDHGSLASSVANGGEYETIVIENEKMKVGVSPKGGGIEYVELKEYKTFDSLPIILFDAEDTFDLSFLMNSGNRNRTSFSNYLFEASENGFAISGEDSKDLTMILKGNGNERFEVSYLMKGNSYDLQMQVRSINMENTISNAQPIFLNWKVEGEGKEKSLSTEKQFTSLNYKYKSDEDVEELVRDDSEPIERTLQWFGFKQYFFSAIAYSDKGFKSDYGSLATEDFEDEGEDAGKTFNFLANNIALPIERSGDGESTVEFYFGPNHYQTLRSYDRNYQDVISLGWWIFGIMNEWVVIPFFNFLNKYIASYGIIILILTVVIKLVLSPLTYKNYLSSAKQKVLKPEVEEINKKFKDGDAVKKQQAMMALYKRTGVNPMAGCVPMLIQLPILYAMFRFFPSSIELRQQSFLWADDLSAYDSILQLPFNIPLYGDHVSLFTLLMAGSTLLYTRMNSSQMSMPSQPGMPNMKVIMYIFPFMMLFFFNSFASGLSYYYLLANIFSMGQMFVIKNYVIDEEKIRKQIASNKKKPTKKSKFQKRLEDMAKQKGYQMPKR